MPVDYDFVEVGTGVYGTISHYCARSHDDLASPVGRSIWSHWRRDRYQYRGLAVDPLQANLDELPVLPHVTKLAAAMDAWPGEQKFYFVSPENIKKHMHDYEAPFSDHPESYPVNVMWYASSLGSLGRPHPNLKHMLKHIGRSDLLENVVVPVLDWTCLCAKFDVRKVDVVQLDCEGKDCAILKGMLRHHKHDLWNLPRVIAFEANHLVSRMKKWKTICALKKHGYKVVYKNGPNVVVERSCGDVAFCAAARSHH